MAKKRVTPEDDWYRLAERVKLSYDGQILDRKDFKHALDKWLDGSNIPESHPLRKNTAFLKVREQYEEHYPYPNEDTLELMRIGEALKEAEQFTTRGIIKGRVVSVAKISKVKYSYGEKIKYRDSKGRFVSVRQKARKKN